MGLEADAIELRVGEEHSVALAGLGTAGYRWAPEVSGDGGVAEVRPASTEAGRGATGASADEVFTIHARKPGAVRVRFEQRRPWEGSDVPAADERTIQVRVI